MKYVKRLFFGALCAAVLWGCSSGGGDTSDDTDMTDADGGLPPVVCREPGPGPGPYSLSFTDITEETGFGTDGLDVSGNTVAVADVNGDHFPDLYVSQGSPYGDNPGDPSGRYRLLVNNGDGTFSDKTWESGLFLAQDDSQGRGSSYAAFADLNNDGAVDVLNVVYFDRGYFNEDHPRPPDDRTAVFLNDGDGTFSLHAGNEFFSRTFNPVAGTVFTDYDHDGNIDVFIGRHYREYGYLDECMQDSLYRGDGTGSFTDVTASAGLETMEYSDESLDSGTNHKPTWSVNACDIDGDGWQELMTTSYGRQFNMLFRNNGGTYTDVTLSSGFAHDGNEDYSDDQMYLCYCATHDDPEYCVDAASPVISCDGAGSWSPGFSDQPYRLGGNSSGTLCEDFDGDGDMDLFAVELAHWWAGAASDKTRLIRNDGFPETLLKSVAEADSGITRSRTGSWNDGDLGAAAADFDNDGLMDVFVLSSDYPNTHSLLYQQVESGVFSGVTDDAGVAVHRAHGGAVIDIDRDGDYDLIIGTSLMRWSSSDYPPRPDTNRVYVFRNDTGQDANRLMIDIAGAGPPEGANRDAIGARIIVHTSSGKLIRDVKSSYGLYGFRNDPLIIIGLGDVCTVEKLEVHWNDAADSVSEYTDLRANYVLKIRQGQVPEHLTLEAYRGEE